MKKLKSILAILTVIMILASVIVFVIQAFLGNPNYLGYFYVAWIIPVMLWVFWFVADLIRKYSGNPEENDEDTKSE